MAYLDFMRQIFTAYLLCARCNRPGLSDSEENKAGVTAALMEPSFWGGRQARKQSIISAVAGEVQSTEEDGKEPTPKESVCRGCNLLKVSEKVGK